MAVLYDENYVTQFEQIRSYMTGASYHYDINNLQDRENQRCLEHYLVKKVVNKEKLTDKENELVHEMFNAFRQRPDEFINSPIIKNGSIDLFTPSKEIADKVRNYRDRYYNPSDVEELFNKYKTQGLNEEESKRFFSILNLCVRRSKDVNTGKYAEIFKYVAQDLLRKNAPVSEMSNAALMFYGQYVANTFNKDLPYSVDINLFARESNLGGHENDYHVFLNKNSKFRSTLAQFTQCVCHENRHAYQEYNSQFKNNKNGFDLASISLLRKYYKSSNPKVYDIYKTNYRYQSIELDAESAGYFNSRVILNMLGRKDLADTILEERQERLDRRDLYVEMINEDNTKSSRDHFIVSRLDEILKYHPEELNNYPLLNAFYNKDGSRRSFGNLIGNTIKEDTETRDLFQHYFNESICSGALDSLDLKTAGIDRTKQLFDKLSSIYTNYSIDINDHLNDNLHVENLTDDNKRQIVNSTLYKIKLAEIVLDYACKNEKALFATRGGKLNNQSYIFNFIAPFRDFDMSKITNPILKENPRIQERMNVLKNKTDFLTMHYNRVYVADRLKDASSEVMTNIITTPDGQQMQFIDYIRDIYEKMDGHQEITVNGRKLYVGDIIAYYKKTGITIQQEEQVEEEVQARKIA